MSDTDDRDDEIRRLEEDVEFLEDSIAEAIYSMCRRRDEQCFQILNDARHRNRGAQ